MKVYIGYQCYYDYCNVWHDVERVFSDKAKAQAWVDEFKRTDTEWRSLNEFEVE